MSNIVEILNVFAYILFEKYQFADANHFKPDTIARNYIYRNSTIIVNS